MKNLCAFAAVALLCAACVKGNTPLDDEEVTTGKQHVTLTFAPYTTETMAAKAMRAKPVTRAAVSVGNVVNRLDLWLMEGDSAKALTQTAAVTENHQTTKDDDFGTLSLMLDKDKTYTLYAIGHKESAPTTMAGGVVTFPDTKKLQTLYYSTTFTPAKTTALSCMMQRAVGMFRIIITDEIPTEVKKIEVTANSTPTQWSFPRRSGITPTDTYNVSWTDYTTETDGTTMFSIYVLGSDTEKPCTVTVSAYAADGTLLKAHTFTDVPIRNNYRTVYRGRFFKDATFSSSFQVEEDWQKYDEVGY